MSATRNLLDAEPLVNEVGEKMTHMPHPARETALKSGSSLQAALVARRFYLDGRQKSEIAEEFGISRFKVARLLDEAKTAGIVRINVDMPIEADTELGKGLATLYGLRHALVTPVPPVNPQAADTMVANLAADYLKSTLSSEDVLGITWGTSVARVIDEIDVLPAIDTVQMVGGVRSSGLDTNGTELVRRLSDVSGGAAFPLMAPLLVDSPTTAKALRSEAAVSQAMDQFDRLSVAVVGVGSWTPRRSSLIDELRDADFHALLEAGAVADVGAVVFDGHGRLLDSPISQRALSITLPELCAIPTVIAVAGGLDKVDAIRAVLSSGVIDVIATDSLVASKLLA